MRVPADVRSSERGMSLPEMIVGMLILSIIGAALVRLMLVNNHFFDHQLALRNARTVSRSAVNLMLSDLRMVDASGGPIDTLGIVSATPRVLRVRVPYAMGIACSIGGNVHVTLVPVDTLMLNTAAYSGYAWRDTALGKYHYIESGALITPGSALSCQAGFTPIPGTQVVAVAPSPPPMLALPPNAGTLALGAPIMLHQQILYELKASTTYPGQIGLWRTLVTGGVAEEIAAPFDTTAAFRFFVGNTDSSQAAVPLLLSDIRGIDFVFNALSYRPAQGRTTPEQVRTTTAVFFKNRLN